MSCGAVSSIGAVQDPGQRQRDAQTSVFCMRSASRAREESLVGHAQFAVDRLAGRDGGEHLHEAGAVQVSVEAQLDALGARIPAPADADAVLVDPIGGEPHQLVPVRLVGRVLRRIGYVGGKGGAEGERAIDTMPEVRPGDEIVIRSVMARLDGEIVRGAKHSHLGKHALWLGGDVGRLHGLELFSTAGRAEQEHQDRVSHGGARLARVESRPQRKDPGGCTTGKSP